MYRFTGRKRVVLILIALVTLGLSITPMLVQAQQDACFSLKPDDNTAPPGARAYHFLVSSSFSASISSTCCPTIFFRRLFSASSSRSRCSSLVSSPPYLLRYRYTVFSDTPSLRHTSAILVPPHTSLSI